MPWDTSKWLNRKGRYFMRWTIKIIFFPISFLLSILTAFLTFLLGIGTALLYLLMMFCIFGAIASFLQKEVTIGIEALIIGFLVSPYGVPIGITRRITIGAICSAHSFFKHWRTKRTSRGYYHSFRLWWYVWRGTLLYWRNGCFRRSTS